MTAAKPNPLLNKVHRMPGQTIRLPSLGKFYKRDELTDDTNNGEIVLYPMSMTDEIMMKSPDMLFQGTAIDLVFKRCSPNILKPLDLLSSDVDYILTHLRKISFGPKIEVDYVCSKCEAKHTVEIELDYFTNESKEINIDEFEKTYVVSTPHDGKRVQIKPITFSDFLLMQQVNTENLNDPDAMRNFILDSFISIIHSVDEINNDSEENRGFIKEWLDSTHREDSQSIIDAIEKAQDFGPTFKFDSKCSKCKHVNTLTTEVNPTAFFIQPSNPKTKI